MGENLSRLSGKRKQDNQNNPASGEPAADPNNASAPPSSAVADDGISQAQSTTDGPSDPKRPALAMISSGGGDGGDNPNQGNLEEDESDSDDDVESDSYSDFSDSSEEDTSQLAIAPAQRTWPSNNGAVSMTQVSYGGNNVSIISSNNGSISVIQQGVGINFISSGSRVNVVNGGISQSQFGSFGPSNSIQMGNLTFNNGAIAMQQQSFNNGFVQQRQGVYMTSNNQANNSGMIMVQGANQYGQFQYMRNGVPTQALTWMPDSDSDDEE